MPMINYGNTLHIAMSISLSVWNPRRSIINNHVSATSRKSSYFCHDMSDLDIRSRKMKRGSNCARWFLVSATSASATLPMLPDPE
ncbi:unnamed protein product [Fusarium graminearum]|uniref:Chromosome 1, complete genome n=1 Tax=Gibberella zeae (strain ATCC MYA-4620 / CBS 123657 / FGSC 9075 / NRRL 31084 / PH-1) TaxID=229533 RepID=A0A0E0RNL4_GIBZE|nr:hypothetical protein FG05_30365 [Fusarium graminearum]CEF72839.1 unnamed protein product [Fusarium graminearum]CZS76106.1 unnamed protein product [Fusarium graminearum]